MPAGRPTELTPEIIAQVAELLPIALYIETVSAMLGIPSLTYRRWLARGKKELKRLSHPNARPKASEAIYAEFCTTVEKAVASGEFRNTKVISDAAPKQWQAAAWSLERRFPERWGNLKEELKRIDRELAELRGDRKKNRRPTKRD